MKTRFRTSTLFLALLIVVFALMTLMFINARLTTTQQASLRAATSYPLPPQVASPTSPPDPGAYPPPRTPVPTSTPAPTSTPEWTPTRKPFPTLQPTPVVTSFPTAAPPLIPPQPREQFSYTMIFRARNSEALRVVRSTGEEFIIDVYAKTGKWLNSISKFGFPAPDGRHVILSMFEGSPPKEDIDVIGGHFGKLYLLDIETKQMRLLVDGGSDPVWSPDSSRVAYVEGSTDALKVMDISSGAIQEVDTSGDMYTYYTPVWSPDGKKLAFTADSGRTGPIKITNLETGVITQVVSSDLKPRTWLWPSDEDLYFVTEDWAQLGGFNYVQNLRKVDVPMHTRGQITQGLEVDVAEVARSPNGKWVVFSAYPAFEGPDPNWHLWLLNTENDNLRRLTEGASSRHYPHWISNHEIIYLKGKSPYDFWIMDLVTGERKKTQWTVDSSKDVIVLRNN